MLVNFYWIEFKNRLLYVILSAIFSMCIAIFEFYTLVIFNTYPFLIFFDQKFILAHVMDFIELLWSLVPSIVFLFILPFFTYQLYQFCKVSWYGYQIYVMKLSLVIINVCVFLNWLFCHLVLAPLVLDFLTQWEILGQSNSLLIIEVELRILNYINWILSFQYNFMNFMNFILVIISHLWIWYKVEYYYQITKNYKKLLIFLTILTIFLFIPPDFFFQILTIFSVWVVYELTFLVICYKIMNSK